MAHLHDKAGAVMSPARRARIGRTSGAVALFTAFLAGMVVQVSAWGVVLAIFGGFLLFALFQAYLLWCLDTVSRECSAANADRNVAVVERDLAYASRDQVWAEARGLIKTSEEIVENSRELMRQRAAHHGLLAGEPSVLQQVVAEAQQRGVEIDYVTLDDLDAAT